MCPLFEFQISLCLHSPVNHYKARPFSDLHHPAQTQECAILNQHPEKSHKTDPITIDKKRKRIYILAGFWLRSLNTFPNNADNILQDWAGVVLYYSTNFQQNTFSERKTVVMKHFERLWQATFIHLVISYITNQCMIDLILTVERL